MTLNKSEALFYEASSVWRLLNPMRPDPACLWISQIHSACTDITQRVTSVLGNLPRSPRKSRRNKCDSQSKQDARESVPAPMMLAMRSPLQALHLDAPCGIREG